MKWFKETIEKKCSCDYCKHVTAAPIDETQPILEDLKDQGYTDVVYRANGMACRKCRRLNGQRRRIDQIILTTRHDAPIFEWPGGHIGCKCNLIVMGKRKPNIRLDYTGIV